MRAGNWIDRRWQCVAVGGGCGQEKNVSKRWAATAVVWWWCVGSGFQWVGVLLVAVVLGVCAVVGV